MSLFGSEGSIDDLLHMLGPQLTVDQLAFWRHVVVVFKESPALSEVFRLVVSPDGSRAGLNLRRG